MHQSQTIFSGLTIQQNSVVNTSQTTTITIASVQEFKQKALRWSTQFSHVLLLDSNSYSEDKYSKIEWKLAVDAIDFIQPTCDYFPALKNFKQQHYNEFICGFWRYDVLDAVLQQEVEAIDSLGFPALFFFQPRYIFEFKGSALTVNRNYPETYEIIERIQSIEITSNDYKGDILFTERTTKEEYIRQVKQIRQRIEDGDFYELNYCTELVAGNTAISPIHVFEQLNLNAEAPFSCFVKFNNSYLMCASPERFLCKRRNKIISQPIKGTIRRGKNEEEDNCLKNELLHSEKERAENVMIVDLVRNDLTLFAETGSICVDELFGVYTFKTVHQMISTISASLLHEEDIVNAIQNAFPMGSMTGAPKLEVRKYIAHAESFNRGLFSGVVGYFGADGDFDSNVVIRSVLYDSKKQKTVIRTGGAITYDSIPEQEYDEIVLKRGALLKSLDGKIID
jgi:para-aminobenzoate synthetase component 1